MVVDDLAFTFDKIAGVKKALFVLLIQSICFAAFPQAYWQQKTDYTIDVTLNTIDKTLDGFEKIVYQNNSPDTLRFVWFHLWPNAYKNDRTAFSDQLLTNDNTAFYFSKAAQRGYINRLDFKVNAQPAKTEDHPQYIDVIKLILPQPLPPGKSATITTPFHVKLPFNFSRGGYDGQSFQVTQWYPKPAVYDAGGWHPMPYLDQGEFYSDFGTFDVTITAPANYVIAATGGLQTTAELEKLKRPNSLKNFVNETKTAKKTINKSISKSIKPQPGVKETALPKTLQYHGENIHDFAFFANKDFIVSHDTCRLTSGKVIDVFSYYTAAEASTWKASVGYAKDAVRFYSDAVGEYPYNTLSVVQGPKSFGGGMEYPTITIISPTVNAKELDITMAHEIGHNWFYGILASNERDHPWMDEGINSFYEKAYTARKYGMPSNGEEHLFQTLAKQHRDQPIETTSEAFTQENYALVAYYKTAQWMHLIEQRLGAAAFQRFMQQYYKDWAFKHPQPANFAAALRIAAPEEVDNLMALQTKKGLLPGEALAGIKIVTPFTPKTFTRYWKAPSKNVLLITPIIGANAYDKLMIGGLFANTGLPPAAFQFAIAPLYATGSKALRGIGRASYAVYPQKSLQKVEASLTAAHFSNNEFVDEAGAKHLAAFTKLAPALSVYLKEKDPHSKRLRYMEWKSFFIGEEPFFISYDSVITPIDTALVQTVKNHSLRYNVQQLKIGIENNRALYPYSASITAQGSANFARLTFEGEYFFNYAKGGLHVRVFAGKFFFDQNKSYDYGYYINRFALNLSGANGEEDYTYSHYFVGRNKFEGLASQQIAVRDGGFKIRTDLLSDKVGKSADWLTAANFSSSLPGLPVKLFADLGTYAEAWQSGAATDRFLFDAGIHIPLFKVVNIYLPIVYSKPFSDYIKSNYIKNKLLKAATFSIDLRQLTKPLRKQLLF
ncbi:MAG: family metallopeptidase [Flaviaesturariibacter sp.]|nr:family metallopeptidase [Flaviaesturariibacter sp.]